MQILGDLGKNTQLTRPPHIQTNFPDLWQVDLAEDDCMHHDYERSHLSVELATLS